VRLLAHTIFDLDANNCDDNYNEPGARSESVSVTTICLQTTWNKEKIHYVLVIVLKS
jgi:hypothetical protein